jgi:hypothetical protein
MVAGRARCKNGKGTAVAPAHQGFATIEKISAK